MHLARYRDTPAGEPLVGVVRDGRVAPIAAALWQLLGLSLQEMRGRVEAVPPGERRVDDVELLAPVDGGTEIWAAGVTYLWSRDAREVESAGFSNAYHLVYDAPRPELFFKSSAWRAVGPGAPIAVRADSTVDVPEPELALVVNRHGGIVGYTVCNDVSSRSIEGENPLYLPQAKVYLGGCALGPMIRPAWEMPDPCDLAIEAAISRAGEQVWSGVASTAQLRRTFTDLVDYLFRADEFPFGVVLSTGTSLVPELPFSLQEGDHVRIAISEIGALENTVVRGKSQMAWLVDDLGVGPERQPAASRNGRQRTGRGQPGAS